MKMVQTSEQRKAENSKLLPYKIIRRAIDLHPERSNLSAIARGIRSTSHKVSFYVLGYSRYTADAFLNILAALGQMKFRKGGIVSIEFKPSEGEYKRLLEISRGDYMPTKSSAQCGDFSRDQDREIHP